MPGGGFEPPIPEGQQIFFTTTVFTALAVCGLDYAFTIAINNAVGGSRLVSTPSKKILAWLGVVSLLQGVRRI